MARLDPRRYADADGTGRWSSRLGFPWYDLRTVFRPRCKHAVGGVLYLGIAPGGVLDLIQSATGLLI